MADSTRGPAPPPRPGQGRPASGDRSARANRRVAALLGGGVLTLALGAVAWAGLHGGGSSTSNTANRQPTGSSVIGPSITKATPAASSPIAVPVGPSVPRPSATRSVAATAAPVTQVPATMAPVTQVPATTAPAVTPTAAPTTPATAKPTTGPSRAAPSRVGNVATQAIAYRVVKGDSLWSLTQRSLRATQRPSSASNVASLITRFYASNSTTIGSDPNLILPGQTITWPVGL